MKFCLALLLSVFRVLVIPAQFEDCPITSEREDIRSMLGEASAYFNSQNAPDTVSVQFELAPTITLPAKTSYYGRNGSAAHDLKIYEAVCAACRQAADSLDISVYDMDDDGEIECVALLTAGLSEADATAEDNIWPQQDRLSAHSGTIKAGGKTIDNYIVIPELRSDAGLDPALTGIGDLCHEFGHILGLPDFYDTDGLGSGGESKAMWGVLSLMDKGNRNDKGRTPPYLNAPEYELLGIGSCEDLAVGEYTLEPLHKGRRYLRHKGPTEGEYFLFEVRDAGGRDEFTGGSGLLVYHMDKTSPYKDRWTDNSINVSPAHQCAYIVADSEAEDVSEVFFPASGRNSFTSGGRPAFKFWDGSTSTLALTDIKRSPDGSVRFKVIEPLKFTEVTPFQDAVLLNWELDTSLGGVSTYVIYSTSGAAADTLDAGQKTGCTIERLKSGKTYEIELLTETRNTGNFSIKTSVTTKSAHSGAMPFIYLESAERGGDGSFVKGTRIPLRLYNLGEAQEVAWYFNGAAITAGADGYIAVNGSGRLKAVALLEDGSRIIIEKEIYVK